jgi:hypothetical protein
MKHLLNNLSSDEKNRIREQYEGGMSIDNSKFKKLIETKLGDSKPLLMEAGKTVDQIIGLGPKSIDNLTKNGVDFVNDLTKLSDEFASRGIKTFDDLSKAAADKAGVGISDITDDMIESYIKNDLKLYQSILAKASNAAYNQVDQLIKNSNLSLIFSKNPEQLRSYQTYISTAPTVRNVNLLINGVDDSIDELEGIIDDVKSGKIPNVKTVPDQLNDIYENLLSKKTDLVNFKKRGNVTDDPTSLLRTTSTLEKELTNVIFNSPESKESAISTLKKMVDDLEKSVYLRRDIQKRWGN